MCATEWLREQERVLGSEQVKASVWELGWELGLGLGWGWGWELELELELEWSIQTCRCLLLETTSRPQCVDRCRRSARDA